IVRRGSAIATGALCPDAEDLRPLINLPITVNRTVVGHLYGSSRTRVSVFLPAASTHRSRGNRRANGVRSQALAARAQVDRATGIGDRNRIGIASVTAELITILKRRVILLSPEPAYRCDIDAKKARRGRVHRPFYRQ